MMSPEAEEVTDYYETKIIPLLEVRIAELEAALAECESVIVPTLKGKVTALEEQLRECSRKDPDYYRYRG